MGSGKGRVLAAVAVLALGAGVLAGCSAGTEGTTAPTDPVATAPRPGGRLVYGLEDDPSGLDPTRNAWDANGIQLANALYDPLAAFDDVGRPQPYLAEALTSSADFRTWTVRLRPGVVFSNGDALDAAALVGYIEALRASPVTGPPARLLTGVTAVDERTVQLTTERPWASLPALLAGQGGYVVSPKQLADPKGDAEPIGTGPFRLRRWEPNRRLELVRNPRYWRAGLPYLDAVDFMVDAQGTERLDTLLRGDVDATAVGTLADLRKLEEAAASRSGRDGLAVEQDPGDAEKTAVLFNTTKSPLNDTRVRQAVAFATDARALAERQGWPPDRLAQGPLGPASPFFSPAAYPGHDADKARALVREYLNDTRVRNRPREVTFTLTAPRTAAALVTQLVEQWAQAGIRAVPTYLDRDQIVRAIANGTTEAAVLRYFAAPDPDVLWHHFVNDTIPASGLSLNFARLRNDDITAGFNEGRASPDVEVRRQAYAKVQQALAQQVPYLWLSGTEWRIASQNRVRAVRNVTLPDGRAALPFVAGTHRLTETWLDR